MFNKEKPVELIIDRGKCVKCRQCVNVCPVEYLAFSNDEVSVNEDSIFGCIQCGHCMMICPENCIEIRGEAISGDDIINFNGEISGFDSVNSLFTKRRSIRKFKKQEIPVETIDKIINAGATAPISLPPSEVKVLAINGFDKVQEFAAELAECYEKALKIMNPFVLNLAKPFIGRANHKMFSEFILPLAKLTVESRKQGKDLLFYDAPAVLVFYATEATDREDPILASAYASIAAESLEIGTCIIGSAAPLLAQSKKLREKYGILKGETPVTAFILGYPDVNFRRGIKRRFKQVNHL